MKKYILEKINNYIPYLENNYPVFLENGERLVEFNFNFDEIVTDYIGYCDLFNSKKKDAVQNIPDSSLNDRYTESKLLESNNIQTSNILISNSNNIQSNNIPSNSNSQNINNNNNNLSNTQNVPLQDHESLTQKNQTNTLNSIPKEEAFLTKNQEVLNEEIDLNGIPIRKDFSEESSNSFLDTSDKIFLETVYSKKTRQEFSIQDINIIDGMMLNDEDLEVFFNALEKNEFFQGKILAVEQNLSDDTSIKISTILKKNIPKITVLDFSQNYKMSRLSGVYIGEALKFNTTLRSISFRDVNLTTDGANRLIESIRSNQTIKDIDFGNLTDSSLKTLGKFLNGEHHLANISFGEDIFEKWSENTKENFILSIRKNQFNRQLLSINIYCEDVWTHYNLIGAMNLFTSKNRDMYLKEEVKNYKMRALEYDQPEYFEEENHLENKYKFSCKSYVQNVFSTILDEGLYYLEKERMNMLRDAEISNVKNEKETGGKFLEDICTANGSVLFLCQFLLTKVDK